MKPKLLLLTGPAAGEVANYLDDEETTERFDVRDYWDAPRRIVGDLEEYQAIDHEIRSLPGGEAWLVGLVLPEHHSANFGFKRRRPELWVNPAPVGGGSWDFEYCRRKSSLPARLAILAPDPPALLVERVKAWGGSVWVCQHHSPDGTNPCHITIVMPGKNGMGGGGRDYWEGTWPEAVRAALGEA